MTRLAFERLTGLRLVTEAEVSPADPGSEKPPTLDASKSS